MGDLRCFAVIALAGCVPFVACGLDVSGQIDGTSPTTVPTTAPQSDGAADAISDAQTDADGATSCIKCGANCVESCAKCSGKTSECDGVCVDGCDSCPSKAARCPGACVPGTTIRQATCRAAKAECRDVACPCTSSNECAEGEIVCDLGRCVVCDGTNDNKSLKCSNDKDCDSDHCD